MIDSRRINLCALEAAEDDAGGHDGGAEAEHHERRVRDGLEELPDGVVVEGGHQFAFCWL